MRSHAKSGFERVKRVVSLSILLATLAILKQSEFYAVFTAPVICDEGRTVCHIDLYIPTNEPVTKLESVEPRLLVWTMRGKQYPLVLVVRLKYAVKGGPHIVVRTHRFFLAEETGGEGRRVSLGVISHVAVWQRGRIDPILKGALVSRTEIF